MVGWGGVYGGGCYECGWFDYAEDFLCRTASKRTPTLSSTCGRLVQEKGTRGRWSRGIRFKPILGMEAPESVM